MEKKLVHCIETMMEKGVNLDWSFGKLTSHEEEKQAQEEDVNDFGKDFEATKIYLTRNPGTPEERLKTYLNKVLRRCEQLESKCRFMQDFQEQTKVLAHQPGLKPQLMFEDKDFKLKEELLKSNKLLNEIQNANELLKSQMVEEQRKAEAQTKELQRICQIYIKKKQKVRLILEVEIHNF